MQIFFFNNINSEFYKFIKNPTNLFNALFYFTAFQAIFCSIMQHLCFNDFRSIFLPLSDDRFADLIKSALSFSRSEMSTQGWPQLFKQYYLNNPYKGIEGLHNGELSHFHCTPLIVLFKIMLSNLFFILNPKYILYLFSFLYFFSIYILIKKVFVNNVFFIFIASALSYPSLFLIFRGNFDAGISFLSATFFLLNLNKLPRWLIYLSAAIAFNVRPNLCILSIILLYQNSFKTGLLEILKLALLTLGLFFISLNFANFIYTDYTFYNFLKGLHIYENYYIYGNAGLQCSNCFTQAIKAILIIFKLKMNFKLVVFFNYIVMLMSLTLIIYLIFKKYISKHESLFVLIVTSTVFTPCLAEYHLTLFLVPLYSYYSNKENNANFEFYSTLPIILSVLILMPKHYIFVNSIDLQIILNPVIMMLSMFMILFRALWSLPREQSHSVRKISLYKK